MTVIRYSDAPRDEMKAAAIIEAFKTEWPTLATANGNKQNGCRYRYRNKLVRKAGYSYEEAYYAIFEASYGHKHRSAD